MTTGTTTTTEIVDKHKMSVIFQVRLKKKHDLLVSYLCNVNEAR